MCATDIDPDAPGLNLPGLSASGVGDSRFGCRLQHGPRYPQWAIGNPPFTGFEQHIDAALEAAPNVAFLLRLAAMESSSRIDCWKRWRLRKVWVLAERPSFTGGGTDSAAYGFFWFERGYRHSADIVPGWSRKGGARG